MLEVWKQISNIMHDFLFPYDDIKVLVGLLKRNSRHIAKYLGIHPRRHNVPSNHKAFFFIKDNTIFDIWDAYLEYLIMVWSMNQQSEQIKLDKTEAAPNILAAYMY